MKNIRWIKKISALLLATLLLLSGCGSGDGAEESQSAGPTLTEDGIELLETPVVIAEGTEGYFKVIRPEGSNQVLMGLMFDVMLISDDVRLNYGTDSESDSENTDREILIGRTDRSASKAAMDALGYDDFSVTYAENKIVIAAHNADRLIEATVFLREKLLREADGRVEYIGNYTYRSDEPLMVEEGESLAEYTIVYGHDNLYASAYAIREYVKTLCGAELPIVFGSAPKAGKEIVIGNADREISSLTNSLSMSEGIIAVKDKDLLIATRDSADTQLLFETFTEEYLSGTFTDLFNFRADLSKKVNIFDGMFKDSAAVTEGSDLRIMSFNVLCDLWGNPAVTKRATTVMRVLKAYAPDVVGLQEMSANWHSAVKSAIKDTPYEMILTEHDYVHSTYGNTNFTPILYNATTLTLLESDTVEFTQTGLRYMKTMAYAYFEKKADGKKFVVLNTHYESPGNNEEEKEEHLLDRVAQTADMVALIAELEEKYDCPILVTGDFNTTEGSDKTGKHAPYWNLIEQAELHDAKKSATRINRACTTWHELGEQVAVVSAGSFDHIFGTERVKFSYFNTLVDGMLMSASDHCPIYADVKLIG